MSEATISVTEMDVLQGGVAVHGVLVARDENGQIIGTLQGVGDGLFGMSGRLVARMDRIENMGR